MKLYNIASTRKLKSGIASMYWQVMSWNRNSDPHRQLEYEELQGLIRHTLDKFLEYAGCRYSNASYGRKEICGDCFFIISVH